MQTNSPSGLELGGYLAVLRRRWIYFLVPVLALPLAAFFLSSRQPDQFSATARVLLGDTAAEEAVVDGSQSTSFRDRVLENELRLATSDEAAREVAARFETVSAPGASVVANQRADILDFRARSANAQSAANIANAWAETYIDLKQQASIDSIEETTAQLENRLAALQLDRADLRSNLLRLQDELTRATDATRERAQLRVDREESLIAGRVTLLDSQIQATVTNITELGLSRDLALGTGPRIVSAARVPSQPISAPIGRDIILGLFLGTVLGAIAVFVRETLDRAVHNGTDLEALGLIHLGSVPQPTRAEHGLELALASLNQPSGAHAAAYQKIRTSIEFIAADQGIESLVVTSAVQGEGKTSASTNLATAMAQSGKRTILVDSDLRRPRIHKVFATKQSPGLTNVVLDNDTLPESAWPIPSLAESFVVIPAGALPPHPPTFLSAPTFGAAAKMLSGLGDFVIIDGAPVLPVADTLTLARHVDGVVLVIAAGRTTTAEVRETIRSLDRSGARVIGAVLIGVRQLTKGYEYSTESESVDWLSSDEVLRSQDRPVVARPAVALAAEPDSPETQDEGEGDEGDPATPSSASIDLGAEEAPSETEVSDSETSKNEPTGSVDAALPAQVASPEKRSKKSKSGGSKKAPGRRRLPRDNGQQVMTQGAGLFDLSPGMTAERNIS